MHACLQALSVYNCVSFSLSAKQPLDLYLYTNPFCTYLYNYSYIVGVILSSMTAKQYHNTANSSFLFFSYEKLILVSFSYN